jgi:hypothetical protein
MLCSFTFKEFKMNKKTSRSHILWDDAIHILRVSENHMYQWAKIGIINIATDLKGRKTINFEDFKKLAHSDKVKGASVNAFWNETRRREDDIKDQKDELFDQLISEMLKKYNQYVATLERIHANYKNKFKVLEDETAETASYILYSRVIALLKMTILCLENRFIEAWILIRSIDEAINLAEYFCYNEDTGQGKKYLNLWFRENISPNHSVCRESIANYMHSKLPSDSLEDIKNDLNILYQKKSKLVHHTFNGIIEYFNAKTDGKKLIDLGFEYGNCSYPRKQFELVEFFQSSIWTSIQSFIHIFNERLPLGKADLKILIDLDNKFLSDMKDRKFRERFDK